MGTDMIQTYTHDQYVDADGRPRGGEARATGVVIDWQNGPLREQGGDQPAEPNGAFVETIIAIAKERIEFYNESQFRCRENSLAITKLEEALHWLNARTARRTAEGVEGTHEGN
jgi:hypothetical protein